MNFSDNDYGVKILKDVALDLEQEGTIFRILYQLEHWCAEAKQRITDNDKEIERLNKELLDWSIQYRDMKERKNKEIAKLKEEYDLLSYITSPGTYK